MTSGVTLRMSCGDRRIDCFAWDHDSVFPMTDLGESTVRHHSKALLNYAVWARMCGHSIPPVPPPLADGSAEYYGLAPEVLATVVDYAERCWLLVRDEAIAVAHDPLQERSRQASLRRRIPHLDSWTAEVLWNQAFRLAMQ